MTGDEPRRRLQWYRPSDDAIRSAVDALAWIRFDPGHLAGKYRSNRVTIAIEVRAGAAWNAPGVMLAGFTAGLVSHHATGLARLDAEVDGNRAATIRHSMRMAEKWTDRFMRPGWAVASLCDVRTAYRTSLGIDTDTDTGTDTPPPQPA